jgi:hypothetical protein
VIGLFRCSSPSLCLGGSLGLGDSLGIGSSLRLGFGRALPRGLHLGRALPRGLHLGRALPRGLHLGRALRRGLPLATLRLLTRGSPLGCRLGLPRFLPCPTLFVARTRRIGFGFPTRSIRRKLRAKALRCPGSLAKHRHAPMPDRFGEVENRSASRETRSDDGLAAWSSARSDDRPPRDGDATRSGT